MLVHVLKTTPTTSARLSSTSNTEQETDVSIVDYDSVYRHGKPAESSSCSITGWLVAGPNHTRTPQWRSLSQATRGVPSNGSLRAEGRPAQYDAQRMVSTRRCQRNDRRTRVCTCDARTRGKGDSGSVSEHGSTRQNRTSGNRYRPT